MAFEELLERAGGVGRFQVLQVFTLLLPAVLTPCHLLLENFSAAIPGHRCWVHILDNGSQVLTNLTHEAFLAVSIPPGPNQQPHHCLRFQEPQWQLLDPNATAANWSEAATEPCMDGWVYDHSTFTSTVVTTWDLVCSSQRLKPMGQSIFMAGILAGAFIWGLLSYRIGRKPMLSWCCLQMAVSSTGAIFAPNFLIYCGLRFLTPALGAVALTILGCTYSTGQMALAGLAFALRDWRDLQLVVSVPLLAISLISWLPESARWLIITGKVDQALRELKKVAKINGHKEAKKTLTTEVRLCSQPSVGLDPRKDIYTYVISSDSAYSFSVMFSYYGLVLDLQSLGRDIFLLQALFGAVDFVGRATNVVFLRFWGRRLTLAGFQALAGFCILTLRVALAVLGKGCFGVSLTCLTVYRAELFPTPLRMTADGFLQSVGRLGALVGPLLRITQQSLPLLPPLSYGAVPIAAGLVLLLFLPETQGLPLPDTIQDLKNQKNLSNLGFGQHFLNATRKY
uniref:Solute carrier family 22 member 11 n=1 Tax=Castor canadensis TaxID=51338 RepID=A0A8C0XNI1_CASCN